MLTVAWATQGYGAPVSVYLFYILKIGLYIGGWLFFCGFSTNLGEVGQLSEWWFWPETIVKAILWSILFEGVGLGSGSGPLTARYLPPFAGILHFVRPGTIKQPLIPNLPLIGGDTRNLFDVGVYLVYLGMLIRALIAPEVTPEVLLPVLILLPILGVLDRTLFLIARGEHYWIALLCFFFVDEALSGAKLVWWAIWWGAATSKLNRHFPSVTAVMISNSAVLQFEWLRKKLYKAYPNDLRPSTFTHLLAHMGTVIEFTFPLLLVFGDGGIMTQVALVMMFCFHLFITSNVPMAVPIEWNFMMVYGAFALFGGNASVSAFALHSPILIGLLILMLVIIPILGNLFPQYISFLLSMRYYAGNWAYSVWLFRGSEAEEKLDKHIVKASQTVMPQLAHFYDAQTSELLVSKVIAFRAMHLHGRVLQDLIPQTVDDIDAYIWRDGELISGVVMGWNFGDGHLHHELLLNAIQKRCQYESGELRCIFVESQPFGRPHLDWRIVDAKDGQLKSGRTSIDELIDKQPWGS